jgi:hypothetical protein
VHVAQIRALIRWDGSTEDIVMELGVDGNPSEAAWFLPVPARATLKLGDSKLFDALQEFTKPEVRIEKMYGEGAAAGGAAPAGAAAVTLLERRTLGPFDVSTLAASDANALGTWLQTHGYNLPEGLAPVVEPYVAQGWYYIAVRLRPGQGETLAGTLDPLWVTFPSEQIIYPMRVMHLAELPHTASFLPLFLYVLADHRVEPPLAMLQVDQRYRPAVGDKLAIKPNMVTFAGWVDPAALDATSPLVPVVPRKLFLTKLQLDIYDPAKIDDDFVFSFAGKDTPYREVEIRYEYVSQPPVTQPPVAPQPVVQPPAAQPPVGAAANGRWLLLIIGIAVMGLLVVRYSWKRS